MIIDQIEADLKLALKEKNEVIVSSLRNAKSEIKNVEIAKQKPLTDEEALQVVAKKVKQHKDSIESFTSGSRSDLVEHEQQQMAVLQKYLPKQMEESEVRDVVRAIASEMKATKSDFGKVMKEVMNRVKGKTEGNVVSKLVNEILE